MEPGVNLLHATSLFGRFSFALLLIIRPDHFGKRTCLYRGVRLFVLLGALLRLARDILPYLVDLTNVNCQSAEFDESPTDLQIASHLEFPYSESVRLAMRQAEVQEYGLGEDDSGDDPIRIPDDILAEMGISPDEIGQ